MAYITPTINYFIHGAPYVKGNCRRCICATLLGEQCTRNTCSHRKCCWQHSTPNNALYGNFMEYQAQLGELNRPGVSSARRARTIQNAKNRFQQQHYNAVRDRYLALLDELKEVEARSNRGTRTLHKKIATAQRILDAYRRANAQQQIFIQLMQGVPVPNANVVVAFNPGDYPPVHGRIPDIVLDRKLSNDDLKARLIEYWERFCGSPGDVLVHAFDHMDLDHLESIMVIGGSCFSGPENGLLPPIILSQGDLDDVALKARLVQYWKTFTGSDSDVMSHAFDEMDIDELKSVVVMGRSAYSAEQLYLWWQYKVNDYLPVTDPATGLPLTEEQKVIVMNGIHRVDPDRQRPEPPVLPDYPNGMVLRYIEVQDSVTGVYFIQIVVVTDQNDAKALGYIPEDAFAAQNRWVDAGVIRTHLNVLWQHHQLLDHEPADLRDVVVRAEIDIPQTMDAWYFEMNPQHPYFLGEAPYPPMDGQNIDLEVLDRLATQVRDLRGQLPNLSYQ